MTKPKYDRKVKAEAPSINERGFRHHPDRLRSETFNLTKRHTDALAAAAEVYVPEKHNPAQPMRPGSLDAYRLPSLHMGRLIYPQ